MDWRPTLHFQPMVKIHGQKYQQSSLQRSAICFARQLRCINWALNHPVVLHVTVVKYVISGVVAASTFLSHIRVVEKLPVHHACTADAEGIALAPPCELHIPSSAP